jgi:hypothetical protein
MCSRLAGLILHGSLNPMDEVFGRRVIRLMRLLADLSQHDINVHRLYPQ